MLTPESQSRIGVELEAHNSPSLESLTGMAGGNVASEESNHSQNKSRPRRVTANSQTSWLVELRREDLDARWLKVDGAVGCLVSLTPPGKDFRAAGVEGDVIDASLAPVAPATPGDPG